MTQRTHVLLRIRRPQTNFHPPSKLGLVNCTVWLFVLIAHSNRFRTVQYRIEDSRRHAEALIAFIEAAQFSK